MLPSINTPTFELEHVIRPIDSTDTATTLDLPGGRKIALADWIEDPTYETISIKRR